MYSTKLKQSLYNYCLNYIEQRLARIRKEIKNIQEAANEDTKSSAGDKHETGRAMAQLEIEKNTIQLSQTQNLLSRLNTITTDKTSETIVSGSLVKTSKGVFYIAISIGIITHEQKEYIIIAGDSPLGKLLMGKKAGESVSWNSNVYTIQVVE